MKKGTTTKRKKGKIEMVNDFISICKIDADLSENEVFKGPFAKPIVLMSNQHLILETAIKYLFEN